LAKSVKVSNYEPYSGTMKRRGTAALAALFIGALLSLSGCASLSAGLSSGDTPSSDQGQSTDQASSTSNGLVMTYDESLGGPPCSSAFCDFFSVTVTNNGNAPVDLYDSICLVADGKTYAENFGASVTQTINPGPDSSIAFDAAFRPADGSHVTEMYLGDCSSGSKDVSLSLDYMASDS